MTVKFASVTCAALLTLASLGCEQPSAPSGGTNVNVQPGEVDVDTPRRDIEVKTDPGGVDVDRDGVNAPDKRAVDVEVDRGRVDVDVDAGAIRDRVQERRAERAADRVDD